MMYLGVTGAVVAVTIAALVSDYRSQHPYRRQHERRLR